MKGALICLLTGGMVLSGKLGNAQNFAITPLVPLTGLVQKEQLWNVILVNPGSQSRTCYLTLTVTDKKTGQQLLTGTANVVSVTSGSRQVRLNDVMPVFYTSNSADIDVGETGFLPPGNYQICYQATDGKQVLGVSCVNAVIELMSPPQLIFPENKSVLDGISPAFSWIPPAPANLIKNAWYEYRLVMVNEGQLPVEAIHDNLPVYTANSLRSTFMNYPAFASKLERDKLYAWQIIASNSTSGSKSEVWTFTIKDTLQQPVLKPDTLSYYKLSSSDNYTGYALTQGFLKFEFINKGTDSIFNMNIIDVTGGNRKPVSIDKEFWPVLTKGKNLITLDLKNARNLKKKHLYQLELEDSEHAIWRLVFEFTNK